MTHSVKISWKKAASEAFVDNKYSREHFWIFEGGIELAASASPHIAPLPMSAESAVDPEETFIASLSSCHLLWFLAIAAGKKYVVESYQDSAEGILSKNTEGKLAMTEVTLKPEVKFGGSAIPTREVVEELHHLAHEKCFIANSVKTKINIIQQ